MNIFYLDLNSINIFEIKITQNPNFSMLNKMHMLFWNYLECGSLTEIHYIPFPTPTYSLTQMRMFNICVMYRFNWFTSVNHVRFPLVELIYPPWKSLLETSNYKRLYENYTIRVLDFQTNFTHVPFPLAHRHFESVITIGRKDRHFYLLEIKRVYMALNYFGSHRIFGRELQCFQLR